MVSIFWDKDCVLLAEYLPQGFSITGEYYVSLLEQLREAIERTRQGKLTKGILLLHNNAPSHTSKLVAAKLQTLGFPIGPPYSPDLAPSDYHLFPILKKHLKGCHFNDIGDVRHAADS